MRILYLDIDTLRPDHLSCYGYHRNTSPNIDAIAGKGTRFENCYVSDAPCLPSRTSLTSGRFGIHTGVINHGGINADMRPPGPERDFRSQHAMDSWAYCLRRAGFNTVQFSPFAERHSAYHFYAGYKEMHNTGKTGQETADEVVPGVLEWLDRHGAEDKWFLHMNVWDPHTPFRTPADYGNPFENDPPPEWMTQERLDENWNRFGPNSQQEPSDYVPAPSHKFPRMPEQIKTMDDYKKWIDGYDVGIHYADHHVGMLVRKLKELGVYEDTLIMLSADHGENQGELNIYGDHHTADHITSRVPLILKGPDLPADRVDRSLHYQNDFAASVIELAGGTVPESWDGISYADAFRAGREEGRDYVVVGNGSWSCQRGVRWDNWIMIRTYHHGLKDFPELMLFDLENDPHETNNLAAEKPEVVNHGLRLLDKWVADMMHCSAYAEDPMWQVIHEGGPFHTRGKKFTGYMKRLRETGRADFAERLEQENGKPAREV